MAGYGDLLGGIAAGGMAGMAAKDAKERRELRRARLKPRSTTPPADAQGAAADAANRADLEAGDTMRTEEQQAEHDVELANGGMVKRVKGYADGGLIAGSKKSDTLKGINAKPAPKSTRDAHKTPPPMIGVRADATEPDIRTEVQMTAANPDNTVALADGGVVPGYATGGLLFGSYIPGGYVQHGSYTQTSDPLWHMECHRDFGKKG